eukprot:CAMPEP_0197054798 /NCGR_PEP_ID=MMETSP1384-20130603/50249_1 /TAXON_ID=29189 /ORGANISM="Ammonia sp." /LENGTH=244 /DNA_ID=CAMNT_0042488111 /DNA_START=61 /DNA_END=795 /DNA_ORIENTATION=-
MAAAGPTDQQIVNNCVLNPTASSSGTGWNVKKCVKPTGTYVFCIAKKDFQCNYQGTHTVTAEAHLHWDKTNGKFTDGANQVSYHFGGAENTGTHGRGTSGGKKLCQKAWADQKVALKAKVKALGAPYDKLALSAYGEQYADDMQAQGFFSGDRDSYVPQVHNEDAYAYSAPGVYGGGELWNNAEGVNQAVMIASLAILVLLIGLLCSFISCAVGGIAGFVFGSKSRAPAKGEVHRFQDDRQESV